MSNLYSTLHKNLNKEITRLNKDKNSPFVEKKYLSEIKELESKLVEKKKYYQENITGDTLESWIFNLYQIYLITTKEKDKPLYKSRLNKYLSGMTKLSYKKLAEEQDPLLLKALKKIPNPQMSTDSSKAKNFIGDFLCNFEDCYQDYIPGFRFYFNEDDDKAYAKCQKKIQRIIVRTYKIDKEKFLKKLRIGFNKKLKDYYYI